MQRAYVDESEPGGGLDHRAYVLSAVVLCDTEHEEIRAEIVAITPSRMRKLHWYEGLAMQRISWLELLQRAMSIIVVRYEGASARAERRRRHCLEHLVWELDARGIEAVVLESRGLAPDARDRSMFDALRRRGIGRALRYEHVRAADEPLVALADLACGAHAAGLDDALGITVVRVG